MKLIFQGQSLLLPLSWMRLSKKQVILVQILLDRKKSYAQGDEQESQTDGFLDWKEDLLDHMTRRGLERTFKDAPGSSKYEVKREKRHDIGEYSHTFFHKIFLLTPRWKQWHTKASCHSLSHTNANMRKPAHGMFPSEPRSRTRKWHGIWHQREFTKNYFSVQCNFPSIPEN